MLLSSEALRREREGIQSALLTASLPLPCGVAAFRLGMGVRAVLGRGLGERSLQIRHGSETWPDPWSAAPTGLPSHCAHTTCSCGRKRGRGREGGGQAAGRRAEAVQGDFLLTASAPPLCSYLCPDPAALPACVKEAGRKEKRE